jgi:hypothetical protein
MRYRIYWDDQENSEVDVVEVDAPNLATAIFLAGIQVALGTGPVSRSLCEVGPLEVVRVETVTWKEVELP